MKGAALWVMEFGAGLRGQSYSGCSGVFVGDKKRLGRATLLILAVAKRLHLRPRLCVRVGRTERAPRRARPLSLKAGRFNKGASAAE